MDALRWAAAPAAALASVVSADCFAVVTAQASPPTPPPPPPPARCSLACASRRSSASRASERDLGGIARRALSLLPKRVKRPERGFLMERCLLSLSLSAFFVYCRHSQKNASPLFCSLFIFPRFAAALNASSGPYPVSPGGVLSVLCSCACASVFEEPRSEGRRETLSFDGCIDRGASFFAAAATLQLSVAARSPAARRRSPCFGGGTGAGGSRAPGSNVMHISCRGATKMRNRKREKSLNFQTRPSNRKLHWRRRPCSIPSLSLSRARPPARRSLSCFPFSTRQTQHINSSLKTEEEAP